MIKYGRLPSYSLVSLVDEHIVRKKFQTSHKDTLDFMEALCFHLIKRPDPLIVPVYAFSYEGYERGHYNYTYDMMRCLNISDEEKRIVNAVGDSWSKGYSEPTHRFLDEDELNPDVVWKQAPKLMQFLALVTEQNRYHDLHSGNVMMNHDYEYCLIDLEGFQNAPLKRSTNQWIIRDSQ